MIPHPCIPVKLLIMALGVHSSPYLVDRGLLSFLRPLLRVREGVGIAGVKQGSGAWPVQRLEGELGG